MKRNFTEEMQMTYKHMKIHLTSAAKMSFQSQTGKKKPNNIGKDGDMTAVTTN